MSAGRLWRCLTKAKAKQATPGALAGLKNLAEPEFLASGDYLRQQTRARKDGAHPDIVRFTRRMIKMGADYGVPLFAHNMLRTMDEQLDLLDRGVTKAPPGSSPHNFGLAVDIVHSRKLWDGMTPEQWELLGALGKEAARKCKVKIEWGGDWDTFWDPAHWQLEGWRKIASGQPT